MSGSGHAIIGTAGHVDHGKTALIRALTGVDTDRLPEEKARGISIELGFAPLRLPSGRRAGVVDVPGHERFVHHMVAGAAGMDAVMLVVAADEGVMPQTREHVEILSLLGVRHGLVALTKVDLVDPELLQIAEQDVRDYLSGTFLAGAPVIPVSSVTGQGLDVLLRELDRLLDRVPGRDPRGPVRLPVDRVFVAPGFGTVVTGTLVSGTVRVGDGVEVLPGGREARVRQVQVHGERVEEATAGQRVALNLAGLEHRFVERGQVVCTPGVYSSTSRLAVRLELLPGAPPLRSGARVHFHLGTAEVSARVVLLDREELAPGSTCLARFGLEDELVAARGDRFVVRSWSPPRTVGGGTVLAPHSWHRRYVASHLESLRELESGGVSGELVALLEEGEVLRAAEDLAGRLGLAPDHVSAVLRELLDRGRVERIAGPEEGGGGEWWASATRMAVLRRRAAELLAAYHVRHPARAGMPRGELRQRLGIGDVRAFSALLAGWEREGTVRAAGDRVSAAHFRPASSGPLARARRLVVEKLTAGRFSPPTAGELIEEVVRAGVEREHAADLLETLAQEGEIVRISGELYLAPEVYRELCAMVTEYLRRHGSMTAAQFRDLLGTTRKYAIPLLEHLDAARVTRRSGDLRLLYGDAGAGSAGRAGRDEGEGHEQRQEEEGLQR